ncbi:hypothetical protein DFA_00174 [Cavenderia fasciculata]|uniref:ComC supersandwich domain-containing protein n=1 Tax=Cavenderia fasciculata TaxID=261658 RepID=F4PXT6_CACFS|nr:uncharacterized protein DFA_00174 [Cavenderia fasciculata]EGG19596.1 hypothetical protein DFA_00174 [Cavenderia fasciculata]|eukprot:XP_004357890.1 hypothetical protein DFA_00174 [Cavenderia fasciculata]
MRQTLTLSFIKPQKNSLHLPPNTQMDMGLPNSNIQFSFPQLTMVSVFFNELGGDKVADINQNIVDKLAIGCPLLNSLTVANDPSLKFVPIIFSSMLSLVTATFRFPGVPTISLPSHPTLSKLEIYGDSNMTEFIIGSSVLLPNLILLSLGIYQDVPNNCALQKIGNFSDTSFPILDTLFFYLGQGPVQQQINIGASKLNALRLFDRSSNLPSNAKININHPESLTDIYYQSDGYVFEPTLDKFSNLDKLTVHQSSKNSYPFQSEKFPQKLTGLYLNSGTMTTIPNVTIPSYINTLSLLENNIVQGSIDFDHILKDTNGSLLLDLSINPNLTGPLVQETSLCGLKTLKLGGTAVTSVPDCFWCYQDPPQKIVLPLGLAKPSAFICQISVDNSTLVTLFKSTVISGSNLGWGSNVAGVSVIPIVPNKIMGLYYPFVPIDGPPQHYIVRLSDTDASLSVGLYLVEAGFIVQSVSLAQSPNQMANLTIQFSVINNYFVHQATLNGTGHDMSIVNGNQYRFYFTNLPFGEYNLVIFNGYYNTSTFNIDYVKGKYKYIYIYLCQIRECTYHQLVTAQGVCEMETNHCHRNGQCDGYGKCVCNINQGAYYNKCSNPYPFITAGQMNNEQRLISLYGDFGPFGQNDTTVTINNTINCMVNQSISNQFNINCSLLSSPTTFGLASVQLNVSGLLYSKGRVLKFIDPSTNPGGSTTSTSGGVSTPRELCQENTQNCYGHGDCDDKGVCQCQEKYNPIDNCATKFADNTTFNANNTSPSSKIEVEGVQFGFEIVAIQEIGVDNEISRELLANSWLSSISTNSTMTNATYDLVISNTSILAGTNVTVTITFSTLPRTVMFGDQQLLINPNSIKLAIHSRYGADGEIQYLRVIKDNVQFNGRFIDFALANGRSTYSQTFVINQTEISGDSDQSVAMIGITLPQCQECILDPDFTPLLVANDKGDNCDGSSNTWKIIVGCVVGGIAFVAIATVSIIFAIKKLKYQTKFGSKMRKII